MPAPRIGAIGDDKKDEDDDEEPERPAAPADHSVGRRCTRGRHLGVW
jgi:hypothetical protein